MAMYRHWVFISRAGTMLHLVLHRHGIVYPDNAHVECRIYEQRVIPNEVKPTVTMLHVFQCSLITTAIIVIVVFFYSTKDSIQILNYSIEFRLGNVIFISLMFDVVHPAWLTKTGWNLKKCRSWRPNYLSIWNKHWTFVPMDELSVSEEIPDCFFMNKWNFLLQPEEF